MKISTDQHRVRHPLAAAARSSFPRTARRGFTLAELLIVVLIMAIVTVATIPFLKPALDSRRIREAARLFTSQLAAAQSQAIANGNSVGVWMEKIHMGGGSGVEGRASMDLNICEVPDPYSGDTTSSTVIVNVTDRNPPGVLQTTGMVTIDQTKDSAWIGLIRPNDLIRFGSSSQYYYFVGNDPLTLNTDNTLKPPPSGPTKLEIRPVLIGGTFGDDYNGTDPAFRYVPPAARTPAGWTTSFQIIRQPVRSAGAPVELPSGAIIDLEKSGMGNSNTFPIFFGDSNPILLMFDRTGAVECIYHGNSRFNVTAPLYFLVGRRDGLSLPAGTSPDYVPNYLDPDNIWVSINRHTGVASTTEVATGGGGSINSSRAFAISAQAMGGK